MEELEGLIEEVRRKPNSFSKQSELLAFLRKSKIRRSDLVHEYGRKVLAKKTRLGSNVWNVMEQVLLACLDVGDIDGAKQIYFELKKQFGKDSTRVQILLGMIYEANGDLDQAKQFYKVFHGKEPMNQLIYKRRICVEKALGNWSNATKLLKNYLQIHTVDQSSWEELGELYIKQNNLKEAAFCFEELILLAPENYHYFTSLAEIFYTIGGIDKLVLARNHYAHSLLLQKEGNLRALFGLQTVTAAISLTKGAKNDDNAKLQRWAATELCDLYKQNDSLGKLVKDLIVNPN